MKLNRGLHLTNTHDTTPEGHLHYARNIMLDETLQYLENEYGFSNYDFPMIEDFCGVIEYDKGAFIFGKLNTNDDEFPIKQSAIFRFDSVENSIDKILILPKYDFSKNHPIRGIHTYNVNKESILAFSSGVEGNFEDIVLNFNSYVFEGEYWGAESHILTNEEQYKLPLNPNISFPEIQSKIVTGTLLSGSYQIAITYVHNDNNTNFSLLSLPVYIYETTENAASIGTPPNTPTEKGIHFTLNNLDLNYTYYRLAIIYNDGISNTIKITNNIKIVLPESGTNSVTFELIDFNGYANYNLDDILVNSIFYSNSESMTIMNNRLYKANLRGHNLEGFDLVGQALANTCLLELVESNIPEYDGTLLIDKDTTYLKFQSDEVYALYLTLGDKKGNVLGSYPIHPFRPPVNLITYPSKSVIDYVTVNRNSNAFSVVLDKTFNFDITVTVFKNEDDYIEVILLAGETLKLVNQANTSATLHSVTPNDVLDYYPYVRTPKETEHTVNYIKATIQSPNDDRIGFWCIHRALRNNNNSRIHSQGYLIANPRIGFGGNNVNKNGLVFVTPSYTPAGALKWQDNYPTSNIGDFKPVTDVNECRYYSFEDLFTKSANINSNEFEVIGQNGVVIRNSDANASTVTYNDRDFVNRGTYRIDESSFRHYNNLVQYNPFMESTRIFLAKNLDNKSPFNRTVNGQDFYNRAFIINVFNNVTQYYKDIYSETLSLCSPIKTLFKSIVTSSDLETTCSGDTFYSIWKLYIKQMVNQTAVNFGNYNALGYADIAAIDNVIIARDKRYYNPVIFIESKYNIHARYWRGVFDDWEQPISDSTQQGYSKVYNKQNTENVTTIKDYTNPTNFNLTGRYPFRIAMSTVMGKESRNIGFNVFYPLDYYDMPYDRGAIQAINNTHRNMYVQQELALFIASVKDVISYDNGSTYIGKGDIFDRLPSEVIPTKYGYIGCSSVFNTALCDIGLWVIDNVRSKAYLITGEEPVIITDGINESYFKNKFNGTNPYLNGNGFMFFDEDRKRLILSMSSETISYYPQIKNFLSFHDYRPIKTFNSRNRTFMASLYNVNESKVGLRLSNFDKSVRCRFFDNIRESIISIVSNGNDASQKLYESIIFNSKFILNTMTQYDKTFSKIMLHNDSQCTGKHDIKENTEWFDKSNGVTINDIWLFNNLFDYVQDNRVSFLNNYVEVNNNINLSKEWFDKSNIMSTFAIVTLWFDNYYYNVEGNKSETFQASYSQPQLVLKDLIVQSLKVNR